MNAEFYYNLLQIEKENGLSFQDYSRLPLVVQTGLDEIATEVLHQKTKLSRSRIESHFVCNGPQLCLAIDADIYNGSNDQDFINACFMVDDYKRVVVFIPSDHAESGHDEYYVVERIYY